MKTLRRHRGQNPVPVPSVGLLPAAPDDGPEDARLQAQWTGGSALATRSVTLVLWAAFAAGPAALVLAAWLILTPAAQPVGATPAPPSRVGELAAAQSFAEHYVVTWLQTPAGQEERLEPFVATTASVALPRTPWVVADPSTAGVEYLSAGTWSVTVAVTVVAPTSAVAPERRYFQVPVTYQAGRLLAQTLPAPVAAPKAADPVELGYRFRVGLAAPAALTVSDFLAALLTGAGDVSRYTTPGTSITPVTPVPYTAVEVHEVLATHESAAAPEQGEQLRLLVTATARVSKQQETSVQYALTLAARSGRWEVKTVDPAPATARPSTPQPN